jgi:hypothetical protein
MATKTKAKKAKSKPLVEKSVKKVARLKAKRPATKAVVKNGLPRPSAKPWGHALSL